MPQVLVSVPDSALFAGNVGNAFKASKPAHVRQPQRNPRPGEMSASPQPQPNSQKDVSKGVDYVLKKFNFYM